MRSMSAPTAVAGLGYIIKRSESMSSLISERAQIAPRTHRETMQGAKRPRTYVLAVRKEHNRSYNRKARNTQKQK